MGTSNHKKTNDTFPEILEERGKLPKQYGTSIRLDKLDDYVINNHLEVKYNVAILNSFYVERKLRNFDSPTEGFSDVTLSYNEDLYYVNKKYLSSHSKYFENLFNEKQGNTIVLKKKENPYDKNPEFFQRFLEVMHGEPALDDQVVGQVLRLGKTYDTPAVMRQCEYFLMNTSKQPLSNKFYISRRYELENLRLQCLAEMKTVADIQAVLPVHKSETMAMLIEKLEQLKKK